MKISILILVSILNLFGSNSKTEKQPEKVDLATIDTIEIYNAVLKNLDNIDSKELSFINIIDSLFRPKKGLWNLIPEELSRKYSSVELASLFIENSDSNLFKYKGRLEIPCYLKEVKDVKDTSRKILHKNSGSFIQFSSVNISKNQKLALMFLKIEGFKKIDYYDTKIVLEKIRGRWFIVYLKTYEMT